MPDITLHPQDTARNKQTSPSPSRNHRTSSVFLITPRGPGGHVDGWSTDLGGASESASTVTGDHPHSLSREHPASPGKQSRRRSAELQSRLPPALGRRGGGIYHYFLPVSAGRLRWDLPLGVLESDNRFACYSFKKRSFRCFHPREVGASWWGPRPLMWGLSVHFQGLGSPERPFPTIGLSWLVSQVPGGDRE